MNVSDWLSAASFVTPEDMVDSAWLEHAPFAFWLVDKLRPRTVVELGSHRGYSYFVFCQAVDAFAINAACSAVDTWRGDEHAGFYDERIYDSVVARNSKYTAFSRLLRMTFDEARGHFADQSIDLLHIDGRHFYEDVKADFESWLPKLSQNAIVLFHDTQVRERDFGVWKFYEELATAHPAFNFHHGHGLGIVAPNLTPASIAPLFSAKPDEIDRIRASYARLGSADAARWLAMRQEERFKAEASKSHRQLKDAKAAEAAVRTELATLKTKAAERERRWAEETARRASQIAARQKAAAEAEIHRRDANLRLLARLRRAGDSGRLPAELSGLRRIFSARARRQAEDYRLIAASPLFEAHFYLAHNPDVAAAGKDPVLHYLVHGWKEGRKPGSQFDAPQYLAANADLAAARVNPLLHFIKYGHREKNRRLAK